MILVLLLILFILMYLVLGKSSIKVFLNLILNFIVLIITFILLSMNISPYLIVFLSSILITKINLKETKGIKYKVSLLSTIISIILLFIIIYLVVDKGILGGFNYERSEEINMFSYNIAISMKQIVICGITLGTLGAIIDSSISVVSSMYEIYENNKNITLKGLIESGFNIGKNIINTSLSTVVFVFFGESMALIILFSKGYELELILNNKTLVLEACKILFISISSLISIPISIYLTSYIIDKKR